MPHLRIEYSASLEMTSDIDGLCDELRRVMVGTGVFPVAGVKVRAFRADSIALADGHPQNGFAHFDIRIGEGRNLETRKRAGEAVFAAAQDFLSSELETGFFSISLIMSEIEANMSWKNNPIHARLDGRKKQVNE